MNDVLAVHKFTRRNKAELLHRLLPWSPTPAFPWVERGGGFRGREGGATCTLPSEFCTNTLTNRISNWSCLDLSMSQSVEKRSPWMLNVLRESLKRHFRLSASADVSAAGVTLTPFHKSARVSAFTGHGYWKSTGPKNTSRLIILYQRRRVGGFTNGAPCSLTLPAEQIAAAQGHEVDLTCASLAYRSKEHLREKRRVTFSERIWLTFTGYASEKPFEQRNKVINLTWFSIEN